MVAAGKVATRYEVVPGITHYGVYGEKVGVTTRLAIDWFGEHLRAAGR